MDPSVQITIAAIGSVTSTITALAIVAILMRLLGEQQDGQVLREISLLRQEMKEYRDRPQVIRWNDDTQHLLSTIPGHISRSGAIKLHESWPSYLKYRGLDIELQVIAKNQHEMLKEAS